MVAAFAVGYALIMDGILDLFGRHGYGAVQPLSVVLASVRRRRNDPE